MTLKEYCNNAYNNAKAHGFHENKNDTMTNKLVELALITSEVGECIEAIRKGDNIENRKQQGLVNSFKESQKDTEEDEIADVCIRIFDYCGEHNIDLEKVINNKMNYNKNRPYKHGKKI